MHVSPACPRRAPAGRGGLERGARRPTGHHLRPADCQARAAPRGGPRGRSHRGSRCVAPSAPSRRNAGAPAPRCARANHLGQARIVPGRCSRDSSRPRHADARAGSAAMMSSSAPGGTRAPASRSTSTSAVSECVRPLRSGVVADDTTVHETCGAERASAARLFASAVDASAAWTTADTVHPPEGSHAAGSGTGPSYFATNEPCEARLSPAPVAMVVGISNRLLDVAWTATLCWRV